jgi:arsenate reductase-like glutaredoxin family protein
MYFRNPCPGAEEAKEFLEEHGVLVMERDIGKKPLSKRELSSILGYQNPKYYLNTASPAYEKEKLDKSLPPRDELLERVTKNPELLRVPIITSGRLMTIGNNRQQLIDMFQIRVSDNGSDEEEKKRGKDKKK